MVQRQVIGAAVASAISLVSGYFALERFKEEASGGPITSVLIVTRDLQAGAELEAGSLGIVGIPRQYVDTRRVPAAEKSSLHGVTLVTSLRAGEALVWSDVIGGSTAEGRLAELIEPGRRAYQISEESNPFRTRIQAGDRVDVLTSVTEGSAIVAENLMVLAVGGSTATGGSPNLLHDAGVSLSTTPNEAAKLLAAERKGKVRLVLRHPRDLTLDPKTEVHFNERSPLPPAAAVEIEHVR